MNADLQRANDLLSAVVSQRDAALNANANAHAEIIDLRRQLQAVKAENEDLKKRPANGNPPATDQPTA